MSPPPTQAVYTIDVYTVHICTGINLNLGCEMRGVMGSLWNPARPSVRLMVRTRSRDLGGLVERQAGQAESGLCIWRWGAGCGGITVGGGSGAKAVLRPEPGERAAAGKCLKPDRTRWNLKDSKVGRGVRSPPLGLTPPEKPYGEQGRKEDLLRSWVCSDVPLPTGCPEAQEVRALQEDAASVGLTGQMP